MGVTPLRAASVLSLIAVFSITGKLVAAAISDRVDLRRLLWGLLALQVAAWALLIARPSLETAFVAAIGLGLGAGGMMPLPALLISACFGPQIFGRVAGLMGPVRLPLNFAIPILGGWLIDLNGGGADPEAYLPTFSLGAALLVVAAAIFAGVRVPPRSTAGQSSP
jgi:MFS family permease